MCIRDRLWTVIERCLRKEPAERPSAENLGRGLRTVAAGIGVHSSAAQVEAALGVAALLAPDPAPAQVPQVPGASDATQVLPGNAGSYDPNAATSVMQQTGNAQSGNPQQGADPTAVMPPVPPGQPRPEDPHPWQSQLQAARDRNEQTQVQYLDPSQDPLRRRPQRQQQRPQQPPMHPQQQQYAPPQPPPQQPAPRQPRPPRQRSSNPMRIPGLGCLKGCLFTLVLLFVAGWLIWELTPLQGWVAQGKSYWEAIGDGISKLSDLISELGGSSDTPNTGQ